jgi:hypothetical protein
MLFPSMFDDAMISDAEILRLTHQLSIPPE